MIVTLTGASAAGKTTIERGLRKSLDNIKPVVSYTTRAPRESDLSGNYLNVSEETFKDMVSGGEFIWWVYLYGNYYGTTSKSLEETTLEQDTIFLMVLEPDSVRTLHLLARKMGIRIISFYILSPSPEILRERLRLRGDSAEEIERRIIGSANWDQEAIKSGIPYLFVNNSTNAKNGVPELAISTITAEISRRISA